MKLRREIVKNVSRDLEMFQDLVRDIMKTSLEGKCQGKRITITQSEEYSTKMQMGGNSCPDVSQRARERQVRDHLQLAFSVDRADDGDDLLSFGVLFPGKVSCSGASSCHALGLHSASSQAESVLFSCSPICVIASLMLPRLVLLLVWFSLLCVLWLQKLLKKSLAFCNFLTSVA